MTGRTPLRTVLVVAGGVAGVIAALVYLGAAAVDLQAQVDAQRATLEREAAARVAADTDRRALAEDVTALRAQVIEQGQTPVAPPPSVDPLPGLTASQARDIAVDAVSRYGISGEAVTAIVDAAVARVELTPGPPGPPGAPGQTPTQAQIVGAVEMVVAAWLAANPPPAGADGRDGTSIVSAAFDAGSCSIVQVLEDADGARATQTFGPLCGRDGQDAFPFSFTYRLPDTGPLRGQKYLCTVVTPDRAGTCEPVQE